MVDQGSTVDVMYLDLYKGLGLKPEDLTTYNSPLVSFEGRLVTPMGLIRLPVQSGTDVVEVDFIVVDFFLRTRLLWADLGFTPLKRFRPPYIRR